MLHDRNFWVFSCNVILSYNDICLLICKNTVLAIEMQGMQNPVKVTS